MALMEIKGLPFNYLYNWLQGIGIKNHDTIVASMFTFATSSFTSSPQCAPPFLPFVLPFLLDPPPFVPYQA
jgi:hypothetical protein